MLHPVAGLAQHAVGHVQRVLRHEVHADALRAHQPHHQLDALDEHLRRLVEEDELGLVQVAHELQHRTQVLEVQQG